MKNKYFIITIDTEADNQWNSNSSITTKNVKFLPRFQELAEKYNYKPVWLVTYEIAQDKYFIKYFKKKQDDYKCEIGMHLHSWSTPPKYELEKINQEKEYLIEYPKNIMEEKIEIMTNIIEENFGEKPISHRSGRWATNNDYFKILDKKGYLIDCSITPHVNWQKCKGATGIEGSDYSTSTEKIKYITKNMLEIPMTIRKIHIFNKNNIKGIKSALKEVRNLIIGKNVWMRPNKLYNKYELKKLIDKCDKKNEYIMFMIHSSELMPNGSPNFKSEEAIEKLYKLIEFIFEYSQKKGYKGITLKEFRNIEKSREVL